MKVNAFTLKMLHKIFILNLWSNISTIYEDSYRNIWGIALFYVVGDNNVID